MCIEKPVQLMHADHFASPCVVVNYRLSFGLDLGLEAAVAIPTLRPARMARGYR